MIRLVWLAAAFLFAPTFVLAQADAGPGGPPPLPQRGFGGPGGRGGPDGLGMGMSRKVVTGLPYSADVTTTMNQTLADGNTISRSETGHVARDSQGRVYMQQNITGGPWTQKGTMKLTFLSDPVGGYTYILNPNDKVAMRREFKAREAGGPPPPPSDPGGSSQARNRVETDLGQQSISGLTANGKLITRTIAAGAIGNAQAITEKSEVWTSPDLQVVLSSTHSDPRMGKTTYTLSNIQRTEPNAALFQVPADYTIRDAPPGGSRGR